MHSITRRGGGGDVRREWGGGAGGSFAQTMKQYDNAHKLLTLIKKGIFTYGDLNPRDNRNQVMCRCSSQITSDYADCPLNPSHLVSPPPPLQFLPLFSQLALITVRLLPSTWYTGVFKTTSFDKNYWHLILQLTLLALLFLHCFFPVHFSQYPLPKKCTLFFLPASDPKIFSPALSFVTIFHFS